ncbi:hypothetical protein C8J56DRAFT_1003357 [Mycena floridula]|nr:hypothetical protein C8J56DRAFT_1003357 [Mycena floridula]
MVASVFISLFLSAVGISAAPSLVARQSVVTTLSAASIAAFTPYSYFANAGYSNCAANSDFKPVASGGDGSRFVGYSPSLKTVIASHQGTDPSQIQSIITDVNFGLASLNATLFPGLSSISFVAIWLALVLTFSSTATVVLAAVQKSSAIALLDAVYLPLHLPTLSYSTYGYGMPRHLRTISTLAKVSSVKRINHEKDFIPIISGRALGFHHPSGEDHIIDSTWYACADNTNTLCTTGYVPNILVGNLDDHLGPYNSADMGC